MSQPNINPKYLKSPPKSPQNQTRITEIKNMTTKTKPRSEKSPPNSSPNQPQITIVTAKIDPKSRKIEVASRIRFWSVLGRQKLATCTIPRLSAGPIWEPFSIKNRKNGIQKGIDTSMPKKYRKLMPQGFKMIPKWMPK